ncbi:MAG: DUF3180 domain-containing protein [Bifidobacteriaceae bacterium]|nr:DUF3180 domain-containing protein [Bifidobacteriaceae bacterium]
MKARHTPWYYFLLAILAGLASGAWLTAEALASHTLILGTTIIVPILLFAVGLTALWLGWTVHKYVVGELKDIEPRRAYITLIIAKSLELAGSVLVGWYSGQILVVAPHLDDDYFKRVALQCAVCAAMSIFDIVCGILAEHWCELPPIDGPENPAKQNQQALAGQRRGRRSRSGKSAKERESTAGGF